MNLTTKSIPGIRLMSISALLCSCATTASGDEPATDGTTQAGLAAESAGPSGESRAKKVVGLKTQIVAIARANQLQTGNEAEVTLTLRPLVDRLVRLAPRRTEGDKLAAVQGTWFSLWSNLGFGPNAPNLARVFQVVRSGHYYNVSESTGPGGETVIGALRGAYSPIPGSLAIRFTRNGFLPGSLAGSSGADIAEVADSIESGATAIVDVPGPVGITGDLSVLYVDDTLRISGGSQTPVFDDNGVVVIPGQFNLLFVLERLEGTVP